MQKSFFTFFAIAIISISYGFNYIPAQNATSQVKKVTVVGYLSDVQCGESLESIKMASEHSKECCLMESCAESGYGIYADGKFIKFDKKGSTKAKAFLVSLKKQKDLKVKVIGELKKSEFLLASIESLN